MSMSGGPLWLVIFSTCQWAAGLSDWLVCGQCGGGCRAGRGRQEGRSNQQLGGRLLYRRTGRGRAAGMAAGRPTPTSRQEVVAGERWCSETSWWRGAELMGWPRLSARAPNWSCEPQRCNTPPWRWAAGRQPRPPIPSADGSSSSSILKGKNQ